MTTVDQSTGLVNGAGLDGLADDSTAPFVPRGPVRTLVRSTVAGGYTIFEPALYPIRIAGQDPAGAALVFKDGTAYKGYSFGAEKGSVAGECVFQTGAYPLDETKGSDH